MRSQFPEMPRTTAEVHDTASRIARTCRIVVQAVMPPEVWAEAEKRFYLTARGELEQLTDGRVTGSHGPEVS
jgi:hypothetical protein